MYSRYAVFFTCAPDDPLARFGASWLGWDSATGRAVARPEISGPDVAGVTRAPHKYGFHGTIKAPFRLASEHSETGLTKAFDALCTNLAPASLPGLHLARLGRFLALVPKGDTDQMLDLAGTVVRHLDPFRAPLNAAEIARRAPEKLTPAQRSNLDRWGYPFVLEEFRFHMTLTDRLDKPTGRVVQAALELALGAVQMPVCVDSLTLMGEGQDGRFYQISRNVLGQPAR